MFGLGKLLSKRTAIVNSANSIRNKSIPDSKILTYPLSRSTGQSEDTLLIKSIKYIAPKAGGSFTDDQRSGKDAVDLDKAASSGKLIGGVYFTGSPTYKVKDGKAYESMEYSIVNMGGMDAKVNKTASSDPSGFQEKINYFIELPIPQQISDSNSVTWGEDTMNIMELAGMAAAGNIVGAKGIGGLAGGFDDLRKKILSDNVENTFPGLTPDVLNGLRAALSGAALNSLGTNVSVQSVLGRSTGQILNSNLELLFSGVNLRSFPFNITFSPRSKLESDRVKAIINALKRSMSAKTGATDYQSNGGVFLKPPDVFLLRYLSNGKDHPFLNSFKPCALTNMSTNYTGSGTYATYGDGTPVNIQVSLMFKEINPVYAEDYDQGNYFGNDPGTGVGV